MAVRDASGNFVPAVQTVPFNPAAPFTRMAQIDDQFTGGYGTALGNLFKNQFRTWSVGVQISLPLRNRTAKANLGKFLEQDRQIDLQTRQLMQRIEVEVRNAVQAVETAKMRINAAELRLNLPGNSSTARRKNSPPVCSPPTSSWSARTSSRWRRSANCRRRPTTT